MRAADGPRDAWGTRDDMRFNHVAAAAVAAGALAACSVLGGREIDDGGKARDQVLNAPNAAPDLVDQPEASWLRYQTDRRTAPTAPPRCEPAMYAHVIGLLREDLDAATLPEKVRILEHDALATTDYDPDRLTIDLGDDGRVNAIHCG